MLDLHEKAATAAKGNNWAAWREVTPAHNALVDAMLGANLHLIATLRTKTAYDVTDDNGKKKPVKVGLAPVQRDGMEYEFTLLFDLTVDGHLATAAKDRTSLFDGQHFTPSQETGATLRAWLDSGVDPVEASRALLDELKAQATAIDNVPHLENWWRARQGEIVALLPVDRERLTAHCAIRKGAILEALTPKPEGKRKGKGNGDDRAAPPAALPAEQAA